ncbi:MAG: flagellar basal body-associated FliL family protein [Alphaproteobacteria bacterium]|nr:flagellar basal body-associated FliL family protein [Alphaproteobacteria bacterium]
MKCRIYILLLAALCLGVASTPQAFANSGEAKEEGGEGEGPPEAPKASMISLKPLPVPLLREDRVRKYIVVMMSLEAPPEADAEAIKHEVPRINDALLREAYLMAKDNDGVEDLDMEALRARLLSVVLSILGDKKINGLYFTGVNSI